jgi:hypothetical protein
MIRWYSELILYLEFMNAGKVKNWSISMLSWWWRRNRVSHAAAKLDFPVNVEVTRSDDWNPA